jgi:hypothetical protein
MYWSWINVQQLSIFKTIHAIISVKVQLLMYFSFGVVEVIYLRNALSNYGNSTWNSVYVTFSEQSGTEP